MRADYGGLPMPAEERALIAQTRADVARARYGQHRTYSV